MPRLALSVLVLVVPVSAARADGPPLVVFLGPAQPDGSAVVPSLEEAARAEGTILVDLAPPAPAPPNAALALQRGVAAYQALDLAAAEKQLSAGIDEAVRTGAAGLSASELVDLYLYRGVSAAARGDRARAWEDFVVAATLSPTRHLDPARNPPSVIQEFERARKAVAAAGSAELRLRVSGSCELFVDARQLGDATAIQVAPGRHHVRAECDGMQRYGALVEVAPGGEEHVIEATPVPSADRAAALREAAVRGHSTVVIARAIRDRRGLSLMLELADHSGKTLGTSSAAISGGGGASPRQVVGQLLDAVRATQMPPEKVVVKEKRRWYQSPWLWAAVGAAAATAVILPFALDDPATAFDVRLGGDTP